MSKNKKPRADEEPLFIAADSEDDAKIKGWKYLDANEQIGRCPACVCDDDQQWLEQTMWDLNGIW